MSRKQKHISVSGLIIAVLVLMNAVIFNAAYTENEKYYWTMLVSVPLLLIAIWDVRQKKQAVTR